MAQVLVPQPGKQTDFLSSLADIVIYGGGAGSGKTRALLMEPFRHCKNPKFRALILRESSPQIRNLGGLWEEARTLYGDIADMREMTLEAIFKSGAKIKFGHMYKENDKYNYDGSQIPLICFDELQAFSESQFRYMFSRNRSDCGVTAYMRCTCNPMPNSWIMKYIEWFIGADGFPLQERSAKLRWFIAIEDRLAWADKKQDLIDRFGEKVHPTSLTFIPATIYDNPALMRTNPQYLARLESLPKVERQRLLEGNWNITIKKGSWFDRKWVGFVDEAPEECTMVRYWDRAATVKDADHRNPDASAGLKMGYYEGVYYIMDLAHFFESAYGVRSRIIEIARREKEVACVIEKDPGAAGKSEAQFLAAEILHNVEAEVRIRRVTTDKVTRFKPFSSATEAGIVYVVRGVWNDLFFQECESFGADGRHHDDIVDATSGAFNYLHAKRIKKPILIAV